MRAAKKTPPCGVELFPNRHNSTAKSAANEGGARRWDPRGSDCEFSHTRYRCVHERRYNACRSVLLQETAQWHLDKTAKENASSTPCAKPAACRPGNRSP